MVLQLPGGKELKFTDDDKERKNFWAKALWYIKNDKAHIVCIRQDTGVSEAVRKHFSDKGSFTTYLLLYLPLTTDEAVDEKVIMLKAWEIIQDANYDALIDADDNFQIIVVDKLDLLNIKVNHAG